MKIRRNAGGCQVLTAYCALSFRVLYYLCVSLFISKKTSIRVRILDYLGARHAVMQKSLSVFTAALSSDTPSRFQMGTVLGGCLDKLKIVVFFLLFTVVFKLGPYPASAK